MKFAVKAWSKERARVGVLQLELVTKTIEIDTPSLLISTRKGLPSFISPDLLPSLPSPDSRLLHSSPLHFLEGLSTKTVSSIGGMHRMLGLDDYGYAAVPRDSIACIPECKGANKNGASFETPCGRITITPVQYMGLISSLKPNLWATLADEVPAWVSEKRNKASVDRTLRWLDECIAVSSTGNEGIFGAIVGGSSVEERRRCSEEVAKRNVSGQSNPFTKHTPFAKPSTHLLNRGLSGLSINPAANPKNIEVVHISSHLAKRKSTDSASSDSSKRLKVLGTRDGKKELLKVLAAEPRMKEDIELIHGARISNNLRSAHDSLFRGTRSRMYAVEEVRELRSRTDLAGALEGKLKSAEAELVAANQAMAKAEEVLKLVQDSLKATEECKKDLSSQVTNVEQSRRFRQRRLISLGIVPYGPTSWPITSISLRCWLPAYLALIPHGQYLPGMSRVMLC